MKEIMSVQDACPHAYLSRGYKIPRSDGYPERAWGAYLPGDEPGWKCSLEDIDCRPDMTWDECPRVEAIEERCLKCKNLVWIDTEFQDRYCPVCDQVLDLDEAI